ncbi:hypothetical protein [Roseateles chitinivorans]|uniref:hypothetical protein n=1 Tax=Roseateles chitinivorans TaxID=2917965 RepID=UPI003D66B0A4
MKMTITLSMLALPLICSAAPVELTCIITSGEKDVEWKVSLDEAAGTASYSIPELNVNQKYKAIFTEDKVVFNGMEISRVDLSFKRTINILGKITEDKGQCKKAAPIKREF